MNSLSLYGGRERLNCDECRSGYFATASMMGNLCPECAHWIYGYTNCAHAFVDGGHCVKCGWDKSTSPFIERLKARHGE